MTSCQSQVSPKFLIISHNIFRAWEVQKLAKMTKKVTFCIRGNEFHHFGNEFSHFGGNEFRPKRTKKSLQWWHAIAEGTRCSKWFKQRIFEKLFFFRYFPFSSAKMKKLSLYPGKTPTSSSQPHQQRPSRLFFVRFGRNSFPPKWGNSFPKPWNLFPKPRNSFQHIQKLTFLGVLFFVI